MRAVGLRIPLPRRGLLQARALVLAPCLLAAAAGSGWAQQPAALCLLPGEVGVRDMVGFWRAEVRGKPGGTILFEKHATYIDSLGGAINRNGERSQVSAEIDGGEFSMEESRDGVHISATWIGDVAESSCGREIRGTWQADGDKSATPFVLKKMD